MLAEIHQKLTDCSIDETDAVTASAHQVHEYETFCVYANTVIGDQWRGGGSNTGNGSDDNKKKFVMLTEMPAEYKGMKCGANGCDKPVDFQTSKRMISRMKSKNIPMDKKDVLCKGCTKKLTDSKIQCSEITCKGGTVLTTNQRGNIIAKRENANTVETNDELGEQSDAGGDTNGSSQETGEVKKLTAAEILKAAGDLTHTEYLEYKRIQSEKFDSEQY